METALVAQGVKAVSLAFMLVYCSVNPKRPSVAGPTGPHDLMGHHEYHAPDMSSESQLAEACR